MMDLDSASPTGTQQPSGEERRKKKRSRFGCNTCRARKVKCDERPNGCYNCEKLHLECSGYSRPPASQAKVGNGKRTYRSCNSCRVARCKCSGERPSCATCRENGIVCSYEDTARAKRAARDTNAMTATPERSSDGRQVSIPESAGGAASDSYLPWLRSPDLPDAKHIRVLMNYYFQNFHPLRCFAFIHKPSFFRRLDDQASGLDGNPLLHIMCTLGAQFYALEHSDTVQQLPTKFIRGAGSHWARTAQRLLLENTDKISVEYLMTAQLLYDYALRMANFTQAFMLSALMARMAQALQINLEYSTDLFNQSQRSSVSTTTRECRRRLMWSCYITDVLCASGVDQLTLIHERDLKIQLPCLDWNFLHERPCVTRTLSGAPLSFVPRELLPLDLDGNIGMMGYYVRQIEIRRRVVQYIKHLDKAKVPWLPDSEFALFDAELRAWYESLPPSLEFTAQTIYTRKESSQLGALCLFHCTYHQTMCDLYRIGTPALYKLRAPFHFPPEQAHFQRHCQWEIFKAARTLAAIIAEGEKHGPRIIADTWLPTIAYDSNRIMLFYLTQITDNTSGTSKRDLILSTIPYLQSNLKALETMRATNAVADGLAEAAETMLEKLGVHSNNIHPLPNIILDDPYLALLERGKAGVPGSPSRSAPDYVLNPLSIFRMARSDIPEGQADSVSTPMPSKEAPSTSTVHEMPEMVPMSRGAHDGDAAVMYESVEGFAGLDMFFAPDQGLDWQATELVVGSGMDGDGLLPWVGATQLDEFAFEAHST